MRQSVHNSFRPANFIALILSFFAISGLMGLLTAGIMLPAVGAGGTAIKAVPQVFEGLPSDIEVVAPAEESLMLDAEGGVIARFYEKRRIVVPEDKIAPIMKDMIVAVEDKRFYEHHGIDPEGIARAFVSNIASADTQGGSTITMQYVRNALLEKGYLEGDADFAHAAVEQTKERKVREIRYALALEKQMDKKQILNGYLNIAPFGPITYGVEAASRLYFSHSASELNYLEAALLAGLVKSPVSYDPLTFPEQALARRDTVLAVALREGLITQEEYDAGINTPLEAMLKPNPTPQGCLGASDTNAYFCDYVVRQFLNDPEFGETQSARERLLKTGGLTIKTTLTPQMQNAARESLLNAIPVDDASDLDTAIVSVEPRTGKVKAMAQNTNYGLEEGETMSNYSADGEFQVGSGFKVFTVIEWLKEGRSAYAAVGRPNRTYVGDEFRCGDSTIISEPWVVTDLPGKDGVFNVITSTGLSINQAFVNMASRVDNFCGIFQTAADFGVTEKGETITPLPANVIGSASTSPLVMATAFAALAGDGQLCTPQSILLVTDRNETVLKEFRPNCKEVVSPYVAQQTATVLTKSTSQYYDATHIADGRKFAAKSGTTNNHANTWLTGFTPELATSTWVGHADSSQMPVENIVINGEWYDAIYGETYVGGRIWGPYMSAALAGTQPQPMPDVFIGNIPQAPRPTGPNRPNNQPNGQAGNEAADSANTQQNGQPPAAPQP